MFSVPIVRSSGIRLRTFLLSRDPARYILTRTDSVRGS